MVSICFLLYPSEPNIVSKLPPRKNIVNYIMIAPRSHGRGVVRRDYRLHAKSRSLISWRNFIFWIFMFYIIFFRVVRKNVAFGYTIFRCLPFYLLASHYILHISGFAEPHFVSYFFYALHYFLRHNRRLYSQSLSHCVTTATYNY